MTPGLPARTAAGSETGCAPGAAPAAAARPREPAADRMPLAADWPRLCHDLRTPLNAILGNTELLLDGSAGPLSSQARACLGDIQLAGQRLMRQVGALLELHRARSAPALAAVPVDLIERLRRAESAAPLDVPQLAIEGAPGGARCVVRGDPGWLGMLADTLIGLYLDGGVGRGPLRVAVEPGGAGQGLSLRLSWVDLDPQQVAALPVALIAAILDLHDGDLLLSGDGLRLDWPAQRVIGTTASAPGVPGAPLVPGVPDRREGA